MPDWLNYKGVEIPEAAPSGEAGLRLKDNFIYIADQLESSGGWPRLLSQPGFMRGEHSSDVTT